MTNISPAYFPLPWRTVVIFWLPSFTSTGQIFVIERVTALPPTWTFRTRTNPSSPSTTSTARLKDHCPRETSALITKTTSPTLTFCQTDCHFFLRFNAGTNSNIQHFQKILNQELNNTIEQELNTIHSRSALPLLEQTDCQADQTRNDLG